VVDGSGLENRHTRKGIGGSNPSLSARLFSKGLGVYRRTSIYDPERRTPSNRAATDYGTGLWAAIFSRHWRTCACARPTLYVLNTSPRVTAAVSMAHVVTPVFSRQKPLASEAIAI
jgi:hypothetical protein